MTTTLPAHQHAKAAQTRTQGAAMSAVLKEVQQADPATSLLRRAQLFSLLNESGWLTPEAIKSEFPWVTYEEAQDVAQEVYLDFLDTRIPLMTSVSRTFVRGAIRFQARRLRAAKKCSVPLHEGIAARTNLERDVELKDSLETAQARLAPQERCYLQRLFELAGTRGAKSKAATSHSPSWASRRIMSIKQHAGAIFRQ